MNYRHYDTDGDPDILIMLKVETKPTFHSRRMNCTIIAYTNMFYVVLTCYRECEDEKIKYIPNAAKVLTLQCKNLENCFQ